MSKNDKPGVFTFIGCLPSRVLRVKAANTLNTRGGVSSMFTLLYTPKCALRYGGKRIASRLSSTHIDFDQLEV